MIDYSLSSASVEAPLSQHRSSVTAGNRVSCYIMNENAVKYINYGMYTGVILLYSPSCQAPAWKELIARKLLLSIRTAACATREVGCKASGPVSDRASPPSVGAVGYLDEDLDDIVADAVAALAVIAGSSGVLYPGAAVQAK